MRRVRVVFECDPATPDLTLVDVEDEAGRSVSVGTWAERPDGRVELRLTLAAGPGDAPVEGSTREVEADR